MKKIYEKRTLLLKQEQKQELKTRAVEKTCRCGTAGEDRVQGRKAQALRPCNDLLHKLLCNSIPLPRHVMKEIETEEGLTFMMS